MARKGNSKIEEVIAKHADKIVFVPWDTYPIDLKGRFCEAGVIEPDVSRDGLLFFDLGTRDPGENKLGPWDSRPLKRASNGAFNEDAERRDVIGDIKTQGYNVVVDIVSWVALGSLVRIIHLRPPMHNNIAGLVLQSIKDNQN